MAPRTKIFFSDAEKLKAEKASKKPAKITKPVVIKNVKSRNLNNSPKPIATIKVNPKKMKVTNKLANINTQARTVPVNQNFTKGPKMVAPVAGLKTVIQTAEAIANDGSHPHNSEVVDLLRTYQRGWMDENSFRDILRNLIL
eukprot:gene8473-17464_t